MSSKIIITGAASGLGKAIAQKVYGSRNRIIGVDIRSPALISQPEYLDEYYQVNLARPEEIERFCTAELERAWPVDILINCAGVNHIGYIDDFATDLYNLVMHVNARAPFLMTRGLLPQLIKSKGTVLNIISNASHMPMTASTAYNASKGALHIMTLQMARELTKRYGITVFGLSPNKLKGTGMSRDIEEQVCEVRGWTPEEAAKYQLSSLLAGEETDPEAVADFIAYLLYNKNNHKYLTGCVIPYGA